MPKHTLTCHHYAFATTIFWATAYVGTKIAAASYTPGPLGFLRCLSATLALLAVAAILGKRPPALRDVPLFLLSGLCGIALYLVLFNKGFDSIGPTTSCIIIATTPVIAAVLARIFLRESLRPAGWLAIGMAFCGILIMTLWNGVLNINAGVVWTAGAAFLFAVYNLLQRRLTVRYDTVTATIYSFAAATALMLPFAPAALAEMRDAPAAHTAIIFFLGVFPSAVAYLLWVKALSIAPKTSYVTNYMFLTPLLSLVLELAIMRQAPDAGGILGGIVILGSLALFVVAGKGDARSAEPGKDAETSRQ